MIDRHCDGIAAFGKPENKISLGFMEGLDDKIRVIQRRAYGMRNEEYPRLKVLTCMLPELDSRMHPNHPLDFLKSQYISCAPKASR